MTKYERIRADGKTIYLCNTKEVVFLGQKCLKGTECDKETNLLTTTNGHYIDHVISLANITKRAEVFYNGRYGTLENKEWFPLG